MKPRMVCALTMGILVLAASGVWGQSACTQNYSLQFDGIDDFVIVPHSATLNFDPVDPFTVEMWIRTTAIIPTGILDSLLEKWNGTCATPYPYTVRLRPQGQVQGACYDSVNCSAGSGVVVTSMNPVNDGMWHHIAYERDAGQVTRLYVDGRLRGSSLFPPFSPTSNTVPLYIGRRGPGGPYTNFFEGEIDEIRISSVNRYVQAFNPDPVHVPDADTVLLLHFDEGFGSNAFDDSPVGNHATLGGAVGVGITDPAWVTSSLPRPLVGLASSVNAGPFDASFKTFWAGQVIQVGTTSSCFPSQLGMPYSLLVNVGPEALISGITPPVGSGVFPTLNGLNILSAFSTPSGTAYLLGDGLGLATVGVGTDIGLPPPLMGTTPTTFAFPVGFLPVGFDLRLQAVYLVPTAPSILLGITNEVRLQAQPPGP